MPIAVGCWDLMIRPVQPQAHLRLSTGWNGDLVPPGCLGALPVRVHRVRTTDHVVVDPILGIVGDGGGTEQPWVVGFVLTEQRTRTLPSTVVAASSR